MNLSNLNDLEALAYTTMLTDSQKRTVLASVAALREMDDTIRTMKRESDDLRAELDRRAQTIADMASTCDAMDRKLRELPNPDACDDDEDRSELHNAAPALAEIADVATDAYDALRALWPSPSQVGIVRIMVPGGIVSHWDVKLCGRRLQAVLCEREDAASVARGLRRVLAAIGRDATTNAAAIGRAPTEPPPAPSCVCGASHDGEDATARDERRAGA